jgi:hypothetical protein
VRIRAKTQIHFRNGHCDKKRHVPPRCEMNTAITGREPMPRWGPATRSEIRSCRIGALSDLFVFAHDLPETPRIFVITR